MTLTEFNQVLEEKKVRHSRVNGFDISFSHWGYAIIEGKFPLSLARKICEGIDNSKLQIRVQGGRYWWSPDEQAMNTELLDIIDDMIESKLFDISDYETIQANYIKELEYKNRLDDVYITKYYIDTIDGLRHIINCIDESGYMNECLF